MLNFSPASCEYFSLRYFQRLSQYLLLIIYKVNTLSTKINGVVSKLIIFTQRRYFKFIFFAIFLLKNTYGKNLSGKAIKECLNGTWFMKNGLEWTDYTPCLDVQVSRLINYTKDSSIQFHIAVFCRIPASQMEQYDFEGEKRKGTNGYKRNGIDKAWWYLKQLM